MDRRAETPAFAGKATARPHCSPFRAATQHRGARSTALSVTQASRKGPAGRRGSGGPQAAACVQPPVLDESLIREQTRVDHFWGELSANGPLPRLG